MPVILIQVKELVVTGTFRYANAYPKAISLAASGAIDLDALVDQHFTLEQVTKALHANRLDQGLMKVMVTPQEASASASKGEICIPAMPSAGNPSARPAASDVKRSRS